MTLASTNPCSRGSPPHLAPRVWGRRAGCAVSWSSGIPEGTRRDASPAAVGAVGRASGYVLFRVLWFRRVLTRDLRGDSLGVCATRGTSSTSDSPGYRSGLCSVACRPRPRGRDSVRGLLAVLGRVPRRPGGATASSDERGVAPRAAASHIEMCEAADRGPRPRLRHQATCSQRCLRASGRLQRAPTSEMSAGLNCFWLRV